MEQEVWISTAAGHASNMRPYRHDLSEGDRERWTTILERIGYGERIASEEFPKILFATPDARESAYNLPHLFKGYGYWILSEASADVLSSFNLGDAMLSPVTILKRDRQTRVGDTWTCINFGNHQKTIVPEESPRMMHGYIRDGRKGWFPPFATNDGDIAVSPPALDGPDIWRDPDAGDCFFLSGPLGLALRKAKLDRGFFLRKCRVLSA